MDKIKVIALEGFHEYEEGNLDNLLAEVFEGEVFEAELYKDTEEYFAFDKDGREFYVGELDFDGNLVLDECFKLIS